MSLERLPFGGEEFQYDTLPGLGSAFAIGGRDIAAARPTDASDRGILPKRAATPTKAAASLAVAAQAIADANETPSSNVAPPKSDKLEEQFISVPDSPKAATIIVSPTRQISRVNADDGDEPSTSGQELPCIVLCCVYTQVRTPCQHRSLLNLAQRCLNHNLPQDLHDYCSSSSWCSDTLQPCKLQEL